MTTVHLSLTEVHALAVRVLRHHGLSDAHAQAIARVITAGERDACHAHGLYRLLTIARTIAQGTVALSAEPVVHERSPAIVAVDARHGFSLLAFEMGYPRLVEKARTVGIAALVINNCFHFSALWPEVEALADAGLAALAMNPSFAVVAPAGGKRPALGTNPIAFAWPRPGGVPYVFDFATSATARGEIELHRRAGKALPPGLGVDAAGQPTTDPAAVLDGGAMLTFGSHKGSALSTMIELLAGPLIGDLTSMDALALADNASNAPRHGELIVAFDPAHFGLGDAAGDSARAERLFAAISDQGARLPSQRRFEARARSLQEGVRISQALHADILALLD